MERNVETSIDEQLRNKKWIESLSNPNRNVYKQEAKTQEQKKALSGKRPDYVLYKEGTSEPLIVIEAKRQGKDLKLAMEQAIDYAKRIKAPIAIATDGIFLRTFHLEKQKPLFLNKEEVDTLLEHSIAVKFLRENEVLTLDPKIIKSREELISIFKDLNNKLSEAGIRAGIERTEFFCNMLFFKVISEVAEQEGSLTQTVPKEYRWNVIREKKGVDLFDFINKQALDHFKSVYGGEVLSPIKELQNYSILDSIVKKLDNLSLSSTNTDIKGDAFEYFLRNYGGADTDFGEYFTPRHIVKTIVKLLNPRFGEKVYDPFCGTGGMLIESYKHIYERMPRNKDSLEQLKKSTIFGGELSEMSRIAKMNMILAGDGHSNILRQDSYANPKKGKYDVVITNIPFGKSRKTSFAGLYGYETKSSEIAGILHCLDALSDNEEARAGIIVPRGITQNTNDKSVIQLREQIIEKHELVSITALSSSTFLPNTGVSADILIIKKKKNINQKAVWHFPVKNDGFSQDTARQKIYGNSDLDILLSENDLKIEDINRLKDLNFTPFFIDKIRKENYSLDILKYNKRVVKEGYKKIGDLVEFLPKSKRPASEGKEEGKFPFFTSSFKVQYCDEADYKEMAIIIGVARYLGIHLSSNFSVASGTFVFKSKNELEITTEYLYYCLRDNFQVVLSERKGTMYPTLNIEEFKNIEIPVPPLEIQLEIQLEDKKIEEHKAYIKKTENNIKNKILKIWQE